MLSRAALASTRAGPANRTAVASSPSKAAVCVALRHASNSSSRKRGAPHPNAVPLDKAIGILKAYEVGQPQQTVELHVHCVPGKGQPPIRGSCVLPRAYRSAPTRVLVFAEGAQAAEAKGAGADVVGGEELVALVAAGQVEFDKCLATPGMLPKVARIARLLGPKGLMPTVNKGTVSDEIAQLVAFARNAQDFRADRANIVHAGVARIGFSAPDIAANVAAVMDSIRANAVDSRARFVGRVYLSSTRGPGVQVADA
ncbi:hypothetical protein GGI11_003152 [Coemansia sp. RSA 2049]|nr:hypothetical protein GGI11_003152 [Coemansia sp. RSA 2049]KAJ2522202.1 hypothetical protein H4217_000893 [Coemansia sp. RSA 1939]KAJ2617830.1 hypothetical protein EV177_000366 [Coemansia sp. RSA 1804]KAJ2695190.1 hypothetical protein GGH99_000267 [Coemansia sp. RSA 1285]